LLPFSHLLYLFLSWWYWGLKSGPHTS
jgi:hypothetical protein